MNRTESARGNKSSRRRELPLLPEQLYVLDNSSGVCAWAEDVFVIALSIGIARYWPVMYPLAIFVIGARQRALATLLHEASHLTLARNRRLNRVLGTWLSGYLVFQTFGAYSRSHIGEHHGRFGSAEDPDFQFHVETGLYGDLSMRALALGLWRYARYLVSGRLLQHGAGTPELLMMAVLWAAICLLAGPMNVLLFWVVPFVFGFGPIGFAIELAEHWPLMKNERALYQTRNRASSMIEAFLFSIHDENFHLIHHLYPRLPMRSMKAADLHLEANSPEYKSWNAANGGILLSANDAPSILQLVLVKLNKR